MNNGGFVMEFRVKWAGGHSSWSQTYGIHSFVSKNLHALDLDDGVEVWPEVHAELGETKEAGEQKRVLYDSTSENDATYVVTGGTLDIHIELTGMKWEEPPSASR